MIIQRRVFLAAMLCGAPIMATAGVIKRRKSDQQPFAPVPVNAMSEMPKPKARPTVRDASGPAPQTVSGSSKLPVAADKEPYALAPEAGSNAAGTNEAEVIIQFDHTKK